MAIPPSAGNPVVVGPYKRIVGVNWGIRTVTVAMQLVFYGPGVQYSCSPNVTLPGVGPWYNSWYTSVYLRGSKFKDVSGVQVIGDDVLPTTRWSWSGLPDYPEDAVGYAVAYAANRDENLENELVEEDYRSQAMIFSDLPEAIDGFTKSPEIEFQLWSNAWTTGLYCDTGVLWRSADIDGFVNYDNGHSTLILSQAIDFSGFQVRNEDTGTVYQAVASAPAEFDERPHTNFILLMKSVPT